jgi:bacterioferritin-associated ferredoxin
MTIQQIKNLIDQEIATTIANIQRHQGVGVYVEACQKWHVQLQTYLKVRGMFDQVMARRSRPDRSRSD